MRPFATSIFLLALIHAVPTARLQAQAPSSKALEIYFLDVEGGQATLVVSPSGQSMLVDAGWPGFEGRDAGRIQAAMKDAHVSRIDYMLVTHYHTDHVGGVPALATKVPMGTFIDHGATVEDSADPAYTAYLEARKKAKNVQAKPGDTILVAGLNVTVVASAGETIKTALPGAGQQNPLCAEYKPQPTDTSENARSVGVVIAYGAFRMLDLGDLTWNVEHGLVCPANLIGPVDLYLTTHHGNQQSGPPALVHAVKPRVAIQNNGTDKGGAPSAWHIVRSSPGLQDFWQLHTAKAGGHDANTADDFIANLDETTSHMIKVSARQDGSFTVTNTRNNVTKTYPAAGAR
jgi:competence protein ComEC